MRIRKLISIFEKLLPIYKKAYNENWPYSVLVDYGLHLGICRATNYELLGVFVSGYYENLCVSNGLRLFPNPTTGKDLKSRIDFMESEINDLNRILKKGYTHV